MGATPTSSAPMSRATFFIVRVTPAQSLVSRRSGLTGPSCRLRRSWSSRMNMNRRVCGWRFALVVAPTFLFGKGHCLTGCSRRSVNMMPLGSIRSLLSAGRLARNRNGLGFTTARILPDEPVGFQGVSTACPPANATPTQGTSRTRHWQKWYSTPEPVIPALHSAVSAQQAVSKLPLWVRNGRRHLKNVIPAFQAVSKRQLRGTKGHSRAPSVIPAPPLRHSRESGNPGVLEGRYAVFPRSTPPGFPPSRE